MSRYRISLQKAGRCRLPVVHQVHGPESRAADAFPCVKWYFGMFRIRNITGDPIELRQKEYPSYSNDVRGSEVAQRDYKDLFVMSVSSFSSPICVYVKWK